MQVEHIIKILNKFGLFGALFLILLSFGKTSLAQSYQEGVKNKSIAVDKKVKLVSWTEYLNNIESSKKVFADGETIEFKVSINNSGKEILNNVKVKDTLPSYLSIIFNPGTYNKSTNTMNGTLISLK